MSIKNKYQSKIKKFIWDSNNFIKKNILTNYNNQFKTNKIYKKMYNFFKNKILGICYSCFYRKKNLVLVYLDSTSIEVFEG